MTSHQQEESIILKNRPEPRRITKEPPSLYPNLCYELFQHFNRRHLEMCKLVSRPWRNNIMHYPSQFHARQRFDELTIRRRLAYFEYGRKHKWEMMPEFRECCQDIKAKTDALQGKLFSHDLSPTEWIRLSVRTSYGKAVEIDFQNEMTSDTAFHLFHLLSHLNGAVFQTVLLSCEADQSFMQEMNIGTIHCQLLMTHGVEDLQLLERRGHYMAPIEISNKLLGTTDVDERFLQLISQGRAYCSSLEVSFVYPGGSAELINRVVRFFEFQPLKSLRHAIPHVEFQLDREEEGADPWPTSCFISEERETDDDGEEDEKREWMFGFANRHSREKFKVYIQDGYGIWEIRRFRITFA